VSGEYYALKARRRDSIQQVKKDPLVKTKAPTKTTKGNTDKAFEAKTAALCRGPRRPQERCGEGSRVRRGCPGHSGSESYRHMRGGEIERGFYLEGLGVISFEPLLPDLLSGVAGGDLHRVEQDLFK